MQVRRGAAAVIGQAPEHHRATAGGPRPGADAGRPSSAGPHGSASAGQPSALNGKVKRVTSPRFRFVIRLPGIPLRIRDRIAAVIFGALVILVTVMFMWTLRQAWAVHKLQRGDGRKHLVH